MPDNPQPPLTELVAGAALQHELFSAYIDAGFTETQAIKLIAALITAGAGGDA